MCRSIKKLRTPVGLPSEEEIVAAARQFVRKISGFQKPSRRNEDAFETAVREIAGVSARLFQRLEDAGANLKSSHVS